MGEEIPRSMCGGREGLFRKLAPLPALVDAEVSLCSSLGIAGSAVVINEGSKEICFWGHSNNRCRGPAA